MATNQLSRVIHSLRSAASPQEAALSDGQLLECYLRSREESAFAALVSRHGPKVWGVCRRVLHSHQDAEDAFQATFLVLVRKGASVSPRDMVANWLYGVAHQTALKARATSAKRRGREKQVIDMPEPAQQPQDATDLSLLDQELSRLPDKHRAVLVLCDLEGKTRKEAALHFKLPEGTVATRLATARSMLAKRLSRAGMTSPSAAITAALSPSAPANVPASLASNTIKAASLFAAGQAAATGVISTKAVVLAEGVIKSMLLTKLKIAAAGVVVLAVLVAGVAALSQRAQADKKPDNSKQKQASADKPAEKPAKDKAPAVLPVKDDGAKNGHAKLVDGSACGGSLVKAVDAQKGTISFDDKARVELAGKTFAVATDAHVIIDGKTGKLADVPAGAFVTLSFSVDQKTIRGITAQGPLVCDCGGTPIKAVDAEKNTLTIADKVRAELAGRTFTVQKDARINVDGKPGKLSDVPADAFVNIQLTVDQQTVRSLDAMGPQIADCNGTPVTAVDAEKGTISFDDKARAELAGKTFTVAADARINVDGKPAKLADVPAGAFVNLTLTVDGKTVRALDAGGPQIADCSGSMVKSVDDANRTISFDDKARAELAGKTFTVASDARISVDNKPGKLSDLAGARVNLGLAVDRKTIRAIDASGPQIADCNGTPVTAVDAEKGTISFDDKARAELAGKTFTVAADARINVDGKAARLSDVPAGAFVNLTLTVDRKTVRALDAGGPPVLCDCGGSLVTAVDVNAGTITFDSKARAEVAGKTFSVVKDANVVIDGKRAKLSELPAGAYVTLLLSVDRKTAISLNAQGPAVPTGGGVIKAVDAQKATVTVDDKTYAVAKDANLLIDGKPATLADLPKGGKVAHLRLSADKKTLAALFVSVK